MNKTIKLAVAGAVFAAASVANAGIIIPAGDWTLDVSGNVNSFISNSKAKGSASIAGGIAGGSAGQSHAVNSQGTGLLPNFLSVSGTTRQNDLDVTFLISIQPGGDVGSSGKLGTQNNRQAYLTFGDKSWGSVKVGKDLGIFASDAILNDMTLLGVGAGAGLGNATYGRIGTGYIYADWKSQIAYTTPNWSGFQATVGVANSWNATSSTNGQLYCENDCDYATVDAYSGLALGKANVSYASANRGGAQPAYEGKASYSFNASGVNGKIWVSGIAQKIQGVSSEDPIAYAGDIGANVAFGDFALTGYYYAGSGIGTTFQFLDGYTSDDHEYSKNSRKARDSDGGYVQALYTLPTKTKLGLSWGQSNLDAYNYWDANGYNNTGNYDNIAGHRGNLVKTNEMWTAGVYHPLTKHLNLVAEYSHIKSENQNNERNITDSGSVGAILFF